MSARPSPWLWGCVLACAAACYGPSPGTRLPPDSPDSTPSTLRSAGPGRALPVRLPSTVDVLLSTSASGTADAPLEITGSSAGPVRLTRLADHLRDARGLDLGPEVWLGPEPGAPGLELDGQTYAGRLLVRVARRGSGLEVLNRLELEDYIAGVLAAELSMWSAQPAELEAQAVACRTFAAHELATPRPYLFSDVRDQVYRGRPPRESSLRVTQAVSRTRGQVLLEDGRLVAARFHAACGGDTARGGLVFPGLLYRCLASVECLPCRGHEGPVEAALGSGDTWRWTLTPDDLELLALELEIGDRVTLFEPASVDSAGRWLSVRFDGPRGSALVSFEELRAQMGTTHLKSARIVRTWPRAGTAVEGGLFLEGRGRGHGVGLCQTGARGYARRGWSATRILEHYYPGAQITRCVSQSVTPNVTRSAP